MTARRRAIPLSAGRSLGQPLAATRRHPAPRRSWHAAVRRPPQHGHARIPSTAASGSRWRRRGRTAPANGCPNRRNCPRAEFIPRPRVDLAHCIPRVALALALAPPGASRLGRSRPDAVTVPY